jgi:predicted DsbA family dithiol-disulfide isomerase
MTFEAPTVEEIAEATGQDFEQVARDFHATAKAAEVSVDEAANASPADD